MDGAPFTEEQKDAIRRQRDMLGAWVQDRRGGSTTFNDLMALRDDLIDAADTDAPPHESLATAPVVDDVEE